MGSTLLMGIAMSNERMNYVYLMCDVRCARIYLNIYFYSNSVWFYSLFRIKQIHIIFIHDAVMYVILFYFHLVWKWMRWKAQPQIIIDSISIQCGCYIKINLCFFFFFSLYNRARHIHAIVVVSTPKMEIVCLAFSLLCCLCDKHKWQK